MKIIADFVTNSSEADYCDCGNCDCGNCNCFCRQCVCSQCRYFTSINNKAISFTDKRAFFPEGESGTLLYEQWQSDLRSCQVQYVLRQFKLLRGFHTVKSKKNEYF